MTADFFPLAIGGFLFIASLHSTHTHPPAAHRRSVCMFLFSGQPCHEVHASCETGCFVILANYTVRPCAFHYHNQRSIVRPFFILKSPQNPSARAFR